MGARLWQMVTNFEQVGGHKGMGWSPLTIGSKRTSLPPHASDPNYSQEFER